MSSWIRCKCDQLVHKNLFCGTGISMIVTEDFLDIERANVSADDFISELIFDSDMLLTCKNCGRLIILRETQDGDEITFYTPDAHY